MDRSGYYSPDTKHLLHVTGRGCRCPYSVLWYCDVNKRQWVVKRLRGPRRAHVVGTYPNPYEAERAAKRELFRLRKLYTV